MKCILAGSKLKHKSARHDNQIKIQTALCDMLLIYCLLIKFLVVLANVDEPTATQEGQYPAFLENVQNSLLQHHKLKKTCRFYK